MINEVTINLNMFSTFIEDIIMSNFNSTSIITVKFSCSGTINLVLFLISLVLILLSKMAGLSTNFIIFLMLFVLLLLSLLLLNFGGKLLLLPFTPSIPLFRIKLFMIYCLVLLPPMTYL